MMEAEDERGSLNEVAIRGMLWVVLEAGWGDYLNRFGTLERSISVTWICSNFDGEILIQSGSQGLLELNQLFVWLKLDTFNQPTQHICKQTSHAVCCFFPEVPCTSLPFALCSGTKSKQSNINNFSYTASTAFAFNFANDFFSPFYLPRIRGPGCECAIKNLKSKYQKRKQFVGSDVTTTVAIPVLKRLKLRGSDTQLESAFR